MARLGDRGPYSATNVEFITFEQNGRDRMTNHPIPNGFPGIGKGRGWSFRPEKNSVHPYEARFRNKRLGCFATEAEARAAYLVAIETFSKGPEA
jgi:hypothetical protein